MRHSTYRCALVATFLLLTLPATRADAGIGDGLKKLGDKAKKKTEETTDQAKGTTEAATPEAAQESRTGGAPPSKVSAVSTKFDYVPGDSVLFFDDLTQDDLGEFPRKWALKEGTFEVAELEGERWLRCTSQIGVVRMKVPGVSALPEFWTLEFDFYHVNDGSNALIVTGRTGDDDVAWEMTYPYSGTNVAFHSGSITVNLLPETSADSRRHRVRFLGRGPALKGYLDSERVLNVPDITGQGAPVTFDFRLASNNHPMITNVRFAEGPRPPKDMLASGTLVTHGILFATGSDVVLPESAPVIRQVAAYLDANKAVRLRIVGHTDDVGSAASNADLSKRRAASVARVLAEQFAIDAARLETDGLGDTRPISSNASAEGKAKNRRVEFSKISS